MAMKTNINTNGCIFQWKIENLSHIDGRNKGIKSPVFIADSLEGTKWSLELNFMKVADERIFGLYLYREKNCSGPEVIEVIFRCEFLDNNGSSIEKLEESECILRKGDFHFRRLKGSEEEEEEEEEEEVSDENPLPEDTITLKCTIQSKGEKLATPNLFFARTVYKVNRRSFVWKIDEFSTRNGIRNKFKDDLIEFDIVLNEVLGFVKKLDIYIISFRESIPYFSFKISIVNSAGEKEEYDERKYCNDQLKKGVITMPLLSKMITENKNRYLVNDVLTLECEFVSSNGTVINEISHCGKILPTLKEVVVEEEKTQHRPVLANDLKSVYNDGIFSDVELRTSTQTFPLHKIILIARSPVFRRMFTSDMKEKNSGHVDITDLDAETVHRMLLYIYTDTLEDLQFENACKLYAAGDKYEVLSLRNSCASFLKGNLCPTKACEVLDLADRHQDDDLKSAVQDFILAYDKEVFGSQEWKQFMVTNSVLASDIMFRKVFPG